MRKWDFTLPRQPDGTWKVQVIEHSPDPDHPGEVLIDLYPLKDEQGAIRSFTSPSDAWDAAMAWKREQQAKQ